MRTFFLFCSWLLVSISAVGQTKTVYFDTDKSALTAEAQRTLNDFVTAKSFAPKDTLTINCHCDVRADSAYNYALSMRRAKSVQTFLQAAGVKNAFVLSAFGEENPEYPNSETERFKNRRCDIILPKKPAVAPAETPEVISVKDWSEGYSLRLEGLEFVGNQALPYSEGMEVLYKLYQNLAEYADVEVALHGHVCCGDDLPLSIARAKAVYDFLVDNGIDSTRLSYSGYSNTRPLVSEIDELTRKHNRRVEMVVVKKPEAEPLVVKPKPLVFKVSLLEILWDSRTNTLEFTGNYNLDLVAKMMARSKGYRYTLRVYAQRQSQLASRISYLNSYFLRKRVTTNKLRLIKGDEMRYAKMDMLTLEVNPTD